MKKRRKTIMIRRKENLTKKGYDGEVVQLLQKK
jgi:hypothetical protein